jgi:hypothetical protein
MIIEYFSRARESWSKGSYRGIRWESLKKWCAKQGIGRLDYYAPPGNHDIYFKQAEDLFLFNLMFGVN